MHKLTVTISGSTGTGKSILASAIYKVLKTFGAEVTIKDDEYCHSYRDGDAPKKFFEDREILIETKQVPKSSINEKPKYEYRVVEKNGKYQAQYIADQSPWRCLWVPIAVGIGSGGMEFYWSSNINEILDIIENHVKENKEPVVAMTHKELFGS